MEITREKIIQILPLSPEIKTKLLEEWDSLTQDLKFELEQILWDGYYALYQMRLQENIQLVLKQAKNTHIALDKSFYDKVREQTEKEMEQEEEKAVDNQELSSIRQRIQGLLA